MPTLNVSAAGVVCFGELPFTTSKGPCTVKSIKGGSVG